MKVKAKTIFIIKKQKEKTIITKNKVLEISNEIYEKVKDYVEVINENKTKETNK